MRVLQLSKFFPPVMGGIESVVFELTEGLNRRGVRTDVLCANTSNQTVTEAHPDGYSVTRTASLGKLLSTSMAPAMLSALSKAAAAHDVIHVHLPDPMTNLALWWTRPAARVVVHWHSDIVAQRRALKLYAPLQNWLLHRSDSIIATSEAYADSSPWLQPFAGKVTVIPIGIREPAKPDPVLVDRIRAEFPARRIVFALGRMTYYKGFDVLIEAARSLPEDMVVLIGGAGELLNHYREMIQERSLEGKVRLLGRIDDARLSSYFAAADVFCLPSTARSEAFGVVLLEAMAASLPIVATDIPGSGVPWVSLNGVTGINVKPNDAQALAAALDAASNDSSRSSMFRRNARQRYVETFTADTMVDATLALYRAVVNNQSPDRRTR